MRIVQLENTRERRLALVDENLLVLLEDNLPSAYAAACRALEQSRSLVDVVKQACSTTTLDYEALYSGSSDWRLLPSFDHPHDAAHCVVSGTGLTHKASAENRAAMHKKENAELTDSMRMYQMGLEGGAPEGGQIGVQPEWFYKGDGSMLKGHGDVLEVPVYGWDGGEEPEIAGAYLVSPDGVPVRVGLTMANEFSDHQMEKKNYLYLAPSKLRNCSIGPELRIGEGEFHDVEGKVSINRDGKELWSKQVWTGAKNMSHTIANLEHHHFKYPMHRRPGDVHIHFFGADAFSFGEGVALQDGDRMEVSFSGFGQPLQNTLRVGGGREELVSVRVL